MKKVWLVIAFLLMHGCGGGGGGGSTEVQPQPPPAETGAVVVKIIDSVPQAAVDSAPQISAAARPAPTKLRLVITNPHILMNGTTFKMIVDGNMVSQLAFGLPVANGYVFELVEYYPDTVKPAGTVPVNRMLKYAKDTENVTVGGVTVTLVLSDITATFTLNDPVISGAVLLSQDVTFQSPTPLQTPWKLFQSTTDILYALHATSGASANHKLDKALIVLTAGQLCAQGEFYIKSTLLDTTGSLTILDTDAATPVSHTKENVSDWTLNYPNPDFGDAGYCVAETLIPVTITP